VLVLKWPSFSQVNKAVQNIAKGSLSRLFRSFSKRALNWAQTGLKAHLAKSISRLNLDSSFFFFGRSSPLTASSFCFALNGIINIIHHHCMIKPRTPSL
jgi:hypothetical protein